MDSREDLLRDAGALGLLNAESKTDDELRQEIYGVPQKRTTKKYRVEFMLDNCGASDNLFQVINNPEEKVKAEDDYSNLSFCSASAETCDRLEENDKKKKSITTSLKQLSKLAPNAEPLDILNQSAIIAGAAFGFLQAPEFLNLELLDQYRTLANLVQIAWPLLAKLPRIPSEWGTACRMFLPPVKYLCLKGELEVSADTQKKMVSALKDILDSIGAVSLFVAPKNQNIPLPTKVTNQIKSLYQRLPCPVYSPYFSNKPITPHQLRDCTFLRNADRDFTNLVRANPNPANGLKGGPGLEMLYQDFAIGCLMCSWFDLCTALVELRDNLANLPAGFSSERLKDTVLTSFQLVSRTSKS